MEEQLQVELGPANRPTQVNMPLLKVQPGSLEQIDTRVAVIQLQTAALTQQYRLMSLPHDTLVSSIHDAWSASHPNNPQRPEGHEQVIHSATSDESHSHPNSPSPVTTCPQAIVMTPQRLQEPLQLPRTPGYLPQPRRYKPATGYEVSVFQGLRALGLI